MIILLKIITDAICGVLFAWGGYDFLADRRFIMPPVIALAVSFITGMWWTGVMILPVMGTLTLPYFGKGFWGRGSWLGLQALIIGLGLCILHFITLSFFCAYVAIALLLGGSLYDIEQVVGDFIFGAWLAVIVWWVSP